MSKESDLDEGIALAVERSQLREKLKGKRIRVLRAVIYEGDAESVFYMLTKSMTVGTHSHVDKNFGRYTITIVEGPIKVVED